MFKISINIILVIIFLSINYSCKNNTQKESTIRNIDSLVSISQNLKITIDSIPFDSIDMFYDVIKDQNKVFKRKLDGLPKDENIRQKLLMYGDIEKGFKKLTPKLKNVRSEIELSKEQLENLKYDVTNNLLKDSTYIAYYFDEKEILDNLTTEVDFMCKIMLKHIKNFYILEKDIKLFVDSLQTTEDKI
jgi:hypothetical protein